MSEQSYPDWESGKEYKLGDQVTVWKIDWICQQEHKSRIFANEVIDDKKWKKA
jgi:hypothetical protein